MTLMLTRKKTKKNDTIAAFISHRFQVNYLSNDETIVFRLFAHYFT